MTIVFEVNGEISANTPSNKLILRAIRFQSRALDKLVSH